MKFHAVIPVHNRLELTVRCLQSLVAQTDRGMSVVLIDDGSTDGTSEVIRKRFPEVQILTGNGNLWWTGAVNLGIRYILSIAEPDDYVVLVNNDTFFERDFISRCRKIAERLPDSLVGSIVVEPTQGKILAGGTKINWYTAKHIYLNAGKMSDEFAPGHLETVSVLTGRGVIIPCKVFREIGLYDDRHFQQCGDTELPRRANLKNFPLYVSYDLVTFNIDPDFENPHKRFGESKFSEYFLGITSRTRLKYRYWFAINTAANPLQGTCFLVCDLARVCANFLRSNRLARLA